MSTDSALHTALALSVSSAVAVLLYRALRPSKPLPPLAPASMIETVAALANPHGVVTFLCEMGKLSASDVFRIAMPDALHTYIIVGEPKLARAILDDATSVKPDFFYQASELLSFGLQSIFSARDHSDGSSWQLSRKAVAPAFHPRHVSMMNDSCTVAYEAWAARALEPAARSGAPIDVCAEVLAMTVAVICDAGLCYSPSPDECAAVLADLDAAAKVVFRTYAVIPGSQYLWWAFADGRKGRSAMRRTLAFCRRLLAHYRGLPEGARRAESIIGRIEANPEYASDTQRCADILAFLIAGHDTSALSLAWLLCHLAEHPDAQAALRAELRAMPADERMRSPLLNATIKESMRLDPVAAGGSLRVPSRDFKIGGASGEAVVPAGAIVWVPYWVIFRHPSIGAEPHAFKPERWLAEGAAKALDDAVFPWASGRRNCVGQALARAELYSLVPRLVCDYSWEVATRATPELGLTWKPQGLALRARRAPPPPGSTD